MGRSIWYVTGLILLAIALYSGHTVGAVLFAGSLAALAAADLLG